jgi:hypothetical protein
MDFHELLEILDSPLLGLQPIDQQLLIAGNTIFKAGQLYAERSFLLFDSFDAQTAIDGPPMPLDCFDKYVRQSMAVDLDRFVQPTVFQRLPNQPTEASTVDLVFEPEQVLALVPEESISHEGLLDLAGDDHPNFWIQQVRDWLENYQGTSISLLDLQKGVDLELVPVWIALLLGDMGNYLSQSKDFYSTSGISITLNKSDS